MRASHPRHCLTYTATFPFVPHIISAIREHGECLVELVPIPDHASVDLERLRHYAIFYHLVEQRLAKAQCKQQLARAIVLAVQGWPGENGHALRAHSNLAASSPPGSGTCRDNIRPAASPNSALSPSKATGMMRTVEPSIGWDPLGSMGFEPGILIETRSADYIRASGHAPRKQAGHMTCTRPQAERQIPLATRAPSTHDPGFSRGVVKL